MQLVGNRLVFSPTDLTHFLECEYLSRLEIEVAHGRVLEKFRTAEADLLAAKGDAHERAQLEQFEHRGLRILQIGETAAQFDWNVNARETQEAMIAGRAVIYQGVLLGQEWRGKADSLVKVNARSALGAWSYEAWDAKLARHAKPSHLLQLAYFSEGLAALQGRDPEAMHLAPSSRRPHRRQAPRQIPGRPDDHGPRALCRFALGHALAHAVSTDFCDEGSR